MNDRIDEVLKISSKASLGSEQVEPVPRKAKKPKVTWSRRRRQERRQNSKNEGVVEMAVTSSMQSFYNHVAGLYENLEAIKNASTTLGQLCEEAMQATTTKQEQKVSQKTREIIDETNQNALQTKTMLESLQKETKEFKVARKIKQSDLR